MPPTATNELVLRVVIMASTVLIATLGFLTWRDLEAPSPRLRSQHSSALKPHSKAASAKPLRRSARPETLAANQHSDELPSLYRESTQHEQRLLTELARECYRHERASNDRRLVVDYRMLYTGRELRLDSIEIVRGEWGRPRLEGCILSLMRDFRRPSHASGSRDMQLDITMSYLKSRLPMNSLSDEAAQDDDEEEGNDDFGPTKRVTVGAE